MTTESNTTLFVGSVGSEAWKSVVGYEGWYAVSNIGRVCRVATGRVLKQQVCSHGYLIVTLCVHGKKTNSLVSHLVADAFLPPSGPTDTVVRHLNDIKIDNRVENLAWGTYSDNLRDAYRNGKNKPPPIHIGEANSSATLAEDQVREIRRLYATGKFSQRELALRFGVAQSVISDIILRKIWKHVV